MARPFWSGQLRISLVSFGISLIPATEAKGEIHFHQIDRRTGARVRNQLVSSADGTPLAKEDVVKGYEFEKNEYVQLEPAELNKLRITSRSVIDVDSFVELGDVDGAYYERPYFVLPENPATAEAFAVVRTALLEAKRAAIGKITLGGRERIFMLAASGDTKLRGMLGYTLRFAEEVRDAADYFSDIPKINVAEEQLALAKELIRQKSRSFDPKTFHDNYEDALRAMIDAKMQHVRVPREKRREPRGKVINLMEALRQSVNESADSTSQKPRRERERKKATVHVMPAKSRNARGRRKSA